MRRTLSTLLIASMILFHGASDLSRHSSAAATADQSVLTIVAPAAPGGGWDQTARVMQQTIAQIEPGASVQVENVPGAAGTIGLARFVSAERGNANALLVTGLVMVSAIVTNHAPVNLGQTTPIARLTGEYEVIVVPAASEWRSLTELVSAFRAAPARISWGGGSAGGTDDLLVRMIASEVGVPASQANYIAFPGGGAALAALLGGQVTAGVSGYGEFAGQIAAGTLRLLAVSSPSRVAGIDAPTLREQGIALDLANWRGIVAPPGLTEAERDALVARIERMAASAEWKAVLAKNGWEDLFLGGTAYRQFLLAEQHRIEAVLRALASAKPSALADGRSFTRLTPQTLPRIAVVGAAVLIVLVVSRRTWPRSRRLPPPLKRWRTSQPAVPLLLLALFVHAMAMPVVGFIPASAALFAITARLMGSRRIAMDVAIGLTGATLLFFVFTRGLGLAL